MSAAMPMTPEPDETGTAATDEGISSLIANVRRLADDARTLAEAELAYQSSRARVAGGAARDIALLGFAAIVLVVFGMGALVVGLLIALVPLVTAWGATALVAGGLILAAAICVLLVLAKVKRAKAALSGKDRA